MKLTRRSVLRSTAAVLAAPALGALGAGSLAPGLPPRTRNGSTACRCSASEIPGGLQEFRLRQSGGAARRHGAADRLRHLRQFQHVVQGVKGIHRRWHRTVHRDLTTPAFDEVSTEYGLLAEAISHPDDRSSVTYRLRADARWQDGKPVTPDDVIFSFNTFKTNSPHFRRLLPSRHQGGTDRRARNDFHIRRAGQP